MSANGVVRNEKKRQTRAAKADETRRALFAAAASVVGKYGYADASVARITNLAGVANGTFYNYFETRQELFEQLLPTLGAQLLDHIRSRSGEAAGIERERRRITAYFEFFQKNPGFLRILNEAEVYAPSAFKGHVKHFATRYTRALMRQRDRAEIHSYSERELEAVVYMLMGARSYLTMLWNSTPAYKRGGASLLADAYLKLVERGLFARGKR